MNPSYSSSSSSSSSLDHEKLDVYRLELEFVSWLNALLEEVGSHTPVRAREVCDQLDRASISMTLNTAEGNGRRPSRARAKFFDDARGSAAECAACLDIMVAKGLCVASRIEAGKSHLLRIVSMLSRLVDRFENTAREVSAAYREGIEDEHEDDQEATR